jgi:hypothetical protein
MIQPRVADWHGDGRWSLVVGEEDGRVAFFENAAPKGEAPRFGAVRYFEQVDPYVKSGALSRPVPVDWNGDGRLDLIAGNSAGYIQYFENTGSPAAPAFEDRGYLKAGGETIGYAGPNTLIQGPVEEKWLRRTPVADWDLDGRLDIWSTASGRGALVPQHGHAPRSALAAGERTSSVRARRQACLELVESGGR